MSNPKHPYKRLWRSRDDRRIAGVCGGIGEYFGVDPVWIRVLFIVFFLAGGAAFIAYLVMWLVVPLKPLAKGKRVIEHDV